MSKRSSHVLRYALVNAGHNVVKNNTTKLIMTPREPKAKRTTMPLGTVPTACQNHLEDAH